MNLHMGIGASARRCHDADLGSFGSFGSFGSWRLNDTEICQAVMVLPAKWMSKIVETLQELGVQ
jgi:hypothetical protein